MQCGPEFAEALLVHKEKRPSPGKEEAAKWIVEDQYYRERKASSKMVIWCLDVRPIAKLFVARPAHLSAIHAD